MKKYIRRCVAGILIVCLAFCMIGCQKQEEDTGPVVRYFFDATREIEGTRTYVITSRAQLEQNVKWILGTPKEVKLGSSDYVHPNSAEAGEGKPFVDYCENYTDAFFENKYLVIVYSRLPSSTYLLQSQGFRRYRYNGAERLHVYLKAVIAEENVDFDYGIYTADEVEAGWHVIYEFDRDEGVPEQDNAVSSVEKYINIFRDVV